ncbi:hypothetical protein HK100_004303, partial [Physocladia obscura]
MKLLSDFCEFGETLIESGVVEIVAVLLLKLEITFFEPLPKKEEEEVFGDDLESSNFLAKLFTAGHSLT